MAKRTTISCTEHTKSTLDDLRPDDIGWDEFLAELADAYEESPGRDSVADTDDELKWLADTLTVKHIDDIAERTARRTADELEGRLR